MESKIEEFVTWLRDHRRLAKGSIRIYRSDVIAFLASGEKPEEWVSQAKTTARLRSRQYSLSAWFKFLGVEKPDFVVVKQHVTPPIYATPDAVMSLLEIVRKNYSEREYMVMLLMYGSGLRLGEVQSLRIGQINFAAKLIRVRGKGNKVRHVPMLDVVAARLRDWLSGGQIRYRRDENDDRVVMGNRGGDYDGDIPCVAITEAMNLAGLGKVHSKPLHWLRHMCATHLYEAGWSIAQIQALLGHENIQTTMLYIHVSMAKMNEMIRVSHPLAESGDQPQFEVIKVAS